MRRRRTKVKMKETKKKGREKKRKNILSRACLYRSSSRERKRALFLFLSFLKWERILFVF